MTKYEYYTLTNSSYLEDKFLNKLGEQGWELVTHTLGVGSSSFIYTHFYTFKREKTDEEVMKEGEVVRMKMYDLDELEAVDKPVSSWMDEYKEDYQRLLTSGMMFEWHPTWTGEWEKDKFAFCYSMNYKKSMKDI
jgi:hypothetical protein